MESGPASPGGRRARRERRPRVAWRPRSPPICRTASNSSVRPRQSMSAGSREVALVWMTTGTSFRTLRRSASTLVSRRPGPADQALTTACAASTPRRGVRAWMMSVRHFSSLSAPVIAGCSSCSVNRQSRLDGFRVVEDLELPSCRALSPVPCREEQVGEDSRWRRLRPATSVSQRPSRPSLAPTRCSQDCRRFGRLCPRRFDGTALEHVRSARRLTFRGPVSSYCWDQPTSGAGELGPHRARLLRPAIALCGHLHARRVVLRLRSGAAVGVGTVQSDHGARIDWKGLRRRCDN
jgi:hypothetical protein